MQQNLAANGLPGRIRRKVPFIPKHGAQMRRGWARSVLDWRTEDWGHVIFSDESKFNLFGSDGRHWCRRRTGDALRPQFTDKKVKHGGGSLMVWGCITRLGVGRLLRVEGTMTAIKYVEILSHGLLGTLSDHGIDLEDFIFQQDNDVKHTSGAAADFFEDNSIFLLHWPSYSANMNIIEHVWDHLDQKVRARVPPPSNIDALWSVLQEEWNQISVEYLGKLYASLPRRVAALRAANGWNTKY
jgi:hypothetical protein